MAYHDVVVRQFGSWDEHEQDRLFEEGYRTALGPLWWAKPDETPWEILLFDGVPCGYLNVVEEPSYIALLEIVILPAFQSRGIGSELLRELTNRARAAGLPIQLQVLLMNDRAKKLYERFGFDVRGRNQTHTVMEFRPVRD